MESKELKELVTKEMERFHCSILLDEVKERVRRLKSYGVNDAEIEAVLQDEDMLPQLVVTKDYRIVLSGNKDGEVKMEPLVKAVYLLFLLHPEGIVLKCLPDYREELKNLYLLLRPKGLTSRVEKSIEDVTNPTLNSINEKCTRVRQLFNAVLPRNKAKYYTISGRRGEAKMIALPRTNVSWECPLPDSQG